MRGSGEPGLPPCWHGGVARRHDWCDCAWHGVLAQQIAVYMASTAVLLADFAVIMVALQ